jgi:hypothetical protein
VALITTRSLPGWARKIAAAHGEPLKDIWAEIVFAVIKEELPASSYKPVADFMIPGIVRRIILRGRPVDWFIWFPETLLPFIKGEIEDDATLAEFDQELQPVLIHNDHMEGWLNSRAMREVSSPKIGEPDAAQPQVKNQSVPPAPDLSAVVEATWREFGDLPRGKFYEIVWQRLGVDLDKGGKPTARGCSPRTIERRLKDIRFTNLPNLPNLAAMSSRLAALSQ